MKIPGNSILSGLGLSRPQPPAAAGPGTQANAAGRTPAGEQAGAARNSAQTASDQLSGAARARNLEQAIQALADQGRLPPRGSLVDLRA